ncbi:MAG TPA: UPF0182 family protein [Candidatus Limnocylindrales bacterium]|nr:UPF0182 family protein [Candidatus Limnocylindrales bacterium]
MGDLFDEFMKELRRRQAEATGRRAPRDGDANGPDGVDRDADAGDAESTGDDDRPADPIPLRPPGGRRRPAPDDAAPRRTSGPPTPPRRRVRVGGPDDGSPSLRSRITTIVVVIAVVFVVLMLVVGIQLWTDAIWFKSVGYDAVFWTRIGVQSGLFALGVALALAVLWGNLWLAGRLSPPSAVEGRGGSLRSWIERLNEAAANADPGGRRGPGWTRWNDPTDEGPIVVGPSIDMPDPVPFGRTVIAIVVVLVALSIGGAVAGGWQTIVLWQHRVPFDPSGAPVVDPIFGRDISFFLFDLPFLRLVQTIATGLFVAALVVGAARYLVSALAGSAIFDTRVRVHLAVLAALVLLSIAAGYQLDKLELVHSDRGISTGLAFTGVHFTDKTAQFLAYDVLTVVSAIAAALLVGGAFARVLWPVTITFAVWFIASFVIGRVYPEVIQRFTVEPNQQAQETPYIANNIVMTRLAFGLDQWSDRPYPGNAPITKDVISADADTFQNARLWDYRPLGDTLDQLQTVRTFYDFYDVDTDRYTIGGDLRQVMLSGRELALDKTTSTPNWVTQRIVYTHGLGAAMVPVNAVASQGQPQLLISEIPPVSTAGAPPISQPRIYFGERPSDYVVVNARQPEFDYLRGDSGSVAPGGPSPSPSSGGDLVAPTDGEIVPYNWTGHSGIPLGTTLDRLLFALRLRDFNLLISDQVTSGSQLLMHRTLEDRLPFIAPFLRYDKDPYLVVDGKGDLVYIQDAFTTSDQFPHAQAFDPDSLPKTGLGSDPFNYIRNSVKIVMNAYDGSMTFYVADPGDPLIRAWQGVFPTLFHPISELPADLVPHLRVPEELFDVQTRMFATYHVTDPATFFSKNDLWEVPVGATNDQSLPTEAYYVVMRMPGSDKAEFLLLQPMVPKGRPNMISWVAARNDPGVYGQTTVFHFPNQSSIFGPAQIEAQIDADPIISAQITLWNQSGSKVVRGNLIVVPVGDSLVYLQPVYLQSKTANFPAFQRIVVASPRNIVWGSSLQEALNLLLTKEAGGGGPSPSPGPTPTPSPGPSGSPGPSATPGPSASPGGPLPSGATVEQLIQYANDHFQLAEQARLAGDLGRYQAEMSLVGQAIAQLRVLTQTP